MTGSMRGEGTPGTNELAADNGPVPAAELCPKCGGGALQRSKRRVLEYPLSLFHIWPFRCKVCQARLLKFSRASFK